MGKISDQPSTTGRPPPVGETTAQTLERLVREQGVKPYDPAAMAAKWPEEFDPDAFNAWLAEERAARRAAVRTRKER